MMPTFLKALMLTGMLLAAVPIIIHLLNRSRFKVESWGAMMFLRRAVQVRAQRIKLEQAALLVMRVLFIVFLALAMARPVSEWGEGSGDDPTTHIVILDGSYSMRQGYTGGNAFNRAKNKALNIVQNMKEADNMLLIVGGNKPELVFPRLSFDRKFLSNRIMAQHPGFDQIMDMPQTIEKGYWCLEQSALPRHRIYVLTDGQQNGWRTEDMTRWRKVRQHRELLKIKPHLYVFEQEPESRRMNTAVVRVYSRSPVVDTYRPTGFLAEIANYGQVRRSMKVEFLVDGKLCAEKDVVCRPGITVVDFEHTFSQVPAAAGSEHAGIFSSHYVTVQTQQDDLSIDDSFSLALEVRHSIPVLVVEGGEAEELWQSDGGMLSLALASTADRGTKGLFDVTRRNLFDIEKSGNFIPEDCKVVVLANVPSLSRHFQFRLEQFVERGGGLLVMLGDRVDAAGYNRMSAGGKGLIPAELIEIESRESRPMSPVFPAGAPGNVLDIFDPNRATNLREVRVTGFWSCRPAGDAVSVGLLDSYPLLLCRAYGDGRVALWTTSADSKWTNLPLTQDYLPLVQNLAVYLSASVQPPINLTQGETLVYSLPNAPSDSSEQGDAWGFCTIVRPDGKSFDVKGEFVGGEWVAEWQDIRMPGVYTVAAAGMQSKYYAVGFRPGEGDVTGLKSSAKRDLENMAVTDFVDTDKGLDIAINAEVGAKEWWRGIMFLGLALLCVESYFGWRFSQ
jgi:hypothetical protein